jgi:hypothetical protein
LSTPRDNRNTRRIKLDRESEQVKKFVRSLPVDPRGSILELHGRPVLRVLPAAVATFDAKKLKAALLRRRAESRRTNAEWQHADAEVWATG